MSEPRYGVTDTGFVPARLDDVREDMRQRMETDLGRPVDPSSDSVIGVILGVIAHAIAWLWSGLQGLWDALSPATATGAALLDQGATVGVYRLPAQRAQTRAITILGDVGATIAPGLTARGLYRGVEYAFTLLEPVTIDGDGVGAGGLWEAMDPGALALPENVVTDLTSGASGANAVTQPTVISGGRNIETFDEFRVRRDTAFLGVGGGNDFAVAARVAALPFIGQSRLRGNRLRVEVDLLPPNSFAVVVWPASGVVPMSEDEEFELAETIAKVQGQGTEPFGWENFAVEDSQGVMQPVAFSYAEPVPYRVQVFDIVKDENYAGDDAVIDAILATAERNAEIGRTVYASSFVCPALAVMGVRSVTIMVARMTGAWQQSVSVGWNEIPVIDHVMMPAQE